jgi:hypothetical protein
MRFSQGRAHKSLVVFFARHRCTNIVGAGRTQSRASPQRARMNSEILTQFHSRGWAQK